jgi:hypothetical protein
MESGHRIAVAAHNVTAVVQLSHRPRHGVRRDACRYSGFALRVRPLRHRRARLRARDHRCPRCRDAVPDHH